MQTVPRNTHKPSIIGMELEELQSIFIAIDEPKYRAKQLFSWTYKRKIQSFAEITNLPNGLINKLKKDYVINPLIVVDKNISGSRKTQKYLLECQDGERIEAVLMQEGKRITLCVSSQIGCALGCKFCASATMGIIRNLSAGEIIGQYLLLVKESKKPITNVVFMGMGEPFLNYDNVIKAANLLNNSAGINLGARHITISTAGIIPQIKQFADQNQRYKLSISLNGSAQEQRFSTMPIAKKYPLDELLDAAKYYYNTTNKLITLEYVLLDGINDATTDAKNLIKLIGTLPCKLNIIPYNEIGSKFHRPSDDKIQEFFENFKNVPFNATIRWSKGGEINAGCGQLAVSRLKT